MARGAPYGIDGLQGMKHGLDGKPAALPVIISSAVILRSAAIVRASKAARVSSSTMDIPMIGANHRCH